MIRYGVAHGLLDKDSYFHAYCFVGRSGRHGPDPILERLRHNNRSSEEFLSSVETLSQAMTSRQAFFSLFRDLTKNVESIYEQLGYLRHVSRYNSELGRLELLLHLGKPSSVSELLDRAIYYAHEGWVQLALDSLLFLLSDDQDPRSLDASSIDRIRIVWDLSLESPIIISALSLVKQILEKLNFVESPISLSGFQLFDCRLSICKWHITDRPQHVSIHIKTLLDEVSFLVISYLLVFPVFSSHSFLLYDQFVHRFFAKIFDVFVWIRHRSMRFVSREAFSLHCPLLRPPSTLRCIR